MRCFRLAVPLALLGSALLFNHQPEAAAQSVTGSVFGTVTDSAGAILVGAPVQLINDTSKQARDATTNGGGGFEFTNILPGNYTLRITQPGFKQYQQTGIIVAPQERVSLHDIRMDVGHVTTTLDVKAEATHVATDSSDRAIDVNLKQIQDTPIRGRDFQAIIKDLAGVQDLDTHDTSGWRTTFPVINGDKYGQVMPKLEAIS